MSVTRRILVVGLTLALGLGAAPPARQPQGRCCQGCKCGTCCTMETPKDKGFQGGKGFRGGGMADQRADMAVFHYLLDHRKQITRKVRELPDGVETLTESKDKEVAAKIQEHALAMHKRLKEGRPLHARDPLFRELFRHHDKVKMSVEKSDGGVRVTEASGDAYVARLIQAHARVVSAFLANGYEEVRKDHEVPARPRK